MKIGIKLHINQKHLNTKQKYIIQQTFYNVNFFWNANLDMLKKQYENTKDLPKEMRPVFPSKYDLGYLRKIYVKEKPFLKISDQTALVETSNKLIDAYHAFFKNHSKKHGKPKFHSSKYGKQSYTGSAIYAHKVSNVRVTGKYSMILPKLGTVYTSNTSRITRYPDYKIKKYTITQEPSGTLKLSLIVDIPDSKPLAKTDKIVGIDVGLKDFAITSDGKKYPAFHDQDLETKIKYWTRHLALRKNVAKYNEALDKHNKALNVRVASNVNGPKKARKIKAKFQQKLANKRQNYLHQITHDLVRQYDVIIIEDLKTSNLLKNHHLAKQIANQSWYQFRSMLEYKCERYGKTLIVVNPKNTSRICSNCGQKNSEFDKLTTNQWLQVRTWTCPNCHAELDRDINAAINIKNGGLKKAKKQINDN